MSFLNEQEMTVICPLHLSVFKLDDGISKNLLAELPLKTYNVKIEENGIFFICCSLCLCILSLKVEKFNSAMIKSPATLATEMNGIYVKNESIPFSYYVR